MKFTSKNRCTWFDNSSSKELYDLQERIESLRRLTSESMQYCLVNQWLYIEQDDLSVYSAQDIENIKIARNYAKLFSNHSVYEIYTLLGVKP
ncbi:three component ABC system middle component [Actinobacillus pleuropneumoniae]|uniref:three component ABC system middle component n=1 Tax=Actinobacillus pleuropneumoniae TaxID=715 RepID=UPI003CFE55CD